MFTKKSPLSNNYWQLILGKVVYLALLFVINSIFLDVFKSWECECCGDCVKFIIIKHVVVQTQFVVIVVFFVFRDSSFRSFENSRSVAASTGWRGGRCCCRCCRRLCRHWCCCLHSRWDLLLHSVQFQHQSDDEPPLQHDLLPGSPVLPSNVRQPDDGCNRPSNSGFKSRILSVTISTTSSSIRFCNCQLFSQQHHGPSSQWCEFSILF